MKPTYRVTAYSVARGDVVACVEQHNPASLRVLRCYVKQGARELCDRVRVRVERIPLQYYHLPKVQA